MRTQSGKLIVDLGDNTSEHVSASFTTSSKSLVDENTTLYNLYPVSIVYNLPKIVKNIYDASTPQIQRGELALNDQTGSFSSSLYLNQDGIIKVVKGANFILSIQAEQPIDTIVENGVPKVKTRKESLIYLWSKDGIAIPNGTNIILQSNDYTQDPRLASSYIQTNDNSLVFVNVTPQAAGNYVCEIKNNNGSVLSEPINIEITNPDSRYDIYFFRNLVQNSYAMDGVNSWTSIQGGLKSADFESEDGFTNLDETLKQPNTPKSGFTPQQFYPYPANINSPYGLGNSLDVWKISSKDSKYFTREDLKSIQNGGLRKIAVYQDIELSDVSDYIRGSVYGVEGVRLFFGCYLGNALSRTYPVTNNVPFSKRYAKQSYFMGAPRIGVENFLWAGSMTKTETVQVVLQEMYNGEPLLSSIINPQTNKTELVKEVILTDPLTRAMEAAKQANASIYPQDIYRVGYTLKPQDTENVVIKAYQSLYPDVDSYYSYGQYVEYSTAYLERLNKKTNKIRITMLFDIDDDRLYEFDRNGDGLLRDLLPWEYAQKRLTFRTQKQWGGEYFKLLENDKTFPADQSKTLVTGFNLSLFPISKTTNKMLGDTALDFKNNVVSIPAKQVDLLNRPKTKPPLELNGLRFEDVVRGTLSPRTIQINLADNIISDKVLENGRYVIKVKFPGNAGISSSKNLKSDYKFTIKLKGSEKSKNEWVLEKGEHWANSPILSFTNNPIDNFSILTLDSKVFYDGFAKINKDDVITATGKFE